jgi:hypothetical protein
VRLFGEQRHVNNRHGGANRFLHTENRKQCIDYCNPMDTVLEKSAVRSIALRVCSIFFTKN